MQKVELDEKPKQCPSCMMENTRGNSYPRVLYKSFECQNPSCPSRSKIGRGKRYDFYGSKRQIMLERGDEYDFIDDGVYKAFRRDIIKDVNINLESLISLYSWSGDKVEIINSDIKLRKYKNRIIELSEYKIFKKEHNFENLNIVKLLKNIEESIVFSKIQT